jgi:hypothetical protein
MSTQRAWILTGICAISVMAFVMLPSVLSAAQPSGSEGEPAMVGFVTANDVFAEVGRRVPGFGGMWVDEDRDTLYIYMLPGGQSRAADLNKSITEVLGSNRPRQTRLEVVQGQYAFLQLKEWHDRISPLVLAIPGAVLTAIDQAANRLKVGVVKVALEPEIEAVLSQMDVPRDAVNIEETVPRVEAVRVEPSDALPAAVTLQSRIRPLVGGIQIALRQGTLKACTLGFYAERNNGSEFVRGFVTNSHCTRVEGGNDATTYWQPKPPPESTKIGVETVDPCFWFPSRTPPTFPPGCTPEVPPLFCPVGRACRLSDSAFARLEIAPGGDMSFKKGFIARPTAEDDLDWDPPDTFFKIVGERTFLTVGDSVSKVGRSTGWTRGKVKTVCANINTSAPYTFICQNETDLDVSVGDSGAPVFECLGDTGPVDCKDAPVLDKAINVNLVGILFTTQGTFSPIGSIRDDTVSGVQNGAHELDSLIKKCAVGRC